MKEPNSKHSGQLSTNASSTTPAERNDEPAENKIAYGALIISIAQKISHAIQVGKGFLRLSDRLEHNLPVCPPPCFNVESFSPKATNEQNHFARIY